MLEVKEDVARVLVNEPAVFGIQAGYTDLTDIHSEWIHSFIFKKNDYTLQAHRGSYKTTCLIIAIALMMIIYPEQNIIFMRKGDEDVKEVIVSVSRLLQTQLFNDLSMTIHDTPIRLTKESAFEIDTNLKATVRGSSQLLGIGSRGSITGKHADIMITDDIVNIDDRISKAHRERTKLQYQELQNIKNRGGRFINTGTPWHKEDAFELMPNIESFDVHSTGLVSQEEIQNLRNVMSPSLFAANYELKHIADEDALFTNPVIDDGSNTEKIYNGVAHIDAAYGGSDDSAFTILNRHDDGNIYVYGSLKQAHIDDVLPEFENKRELYRAGTLYNELNADKGYLAKKIRRPVKTYHEKMNKYIKISTYLREEWENIVFIKGTDPEYINQILDFTENATSDDAPDSLASLLRETQSNLKVQLFKHGI